MPLSFVRDDITHLAVDAIVNAANRRLLPGGGVCGAIFAAAGPRLIPACLAQSPCEIGQSVITPGFRLRAKHVIHTVGPIWRGGHRGEEAQLRSCYRTALALAEQNHLESIAFPLISAGIYGYPPEQALAVAVSEISAYLAHSDLDVTLVFFDSRLTALGLDHDPELRQFIDDNYVEQSPFLRRREAELQRDMMFAEADDAPQPDMIFAENNAPQPDMMFAAKEAPQPDMMATADAGDAPDADEAPQPGMLFPADAAAPKAGSMSPADGKAQGRPKRGATSPAGGSAPSARAQALQSARADIPGPCRAARPAPQDAALEEMLSRMGETFSHMLLRMIDERGWKDSDVYHRANIDRKHFSKIRNNPQYHPKKETALAFAVALELSVEDADALLRTAGYAMSRADRRDLIVRYYLTRREYDIHRINLKLFSYQEAPLGC